ncbi:MAG: type IX secretion system membrane protein PorP/SprF [Bacteroidia bacterium]
MRSRIFILITFSFAAVNDALAQDPQFSQFYANPLYTNPAFAGASGKYRFVITGRDQYTALQNNYRTGSASFDASIPSLGGGLGVIATTDVAGDGRLTTNTFSAVYAYQVNVNRFLTMRAGIEASLFQKGLDFSKFQFGDMIDDRYGFIYKTNELIPTQQRMFPNFDAGFLAYTQLFFAGFAVHNITQPNQSFYDKNSSADQFLLPRRYTAHAGLNLYLNYSRYDEERLLLSPNIIYMQQRNYNQLNLGFYIKKQALTAGMWFRQTSQNSDALIFLVGIKLTKFRIGYSYDLTVSGAHTATQGSNEISLAFEFLPPKHEGRVFKPLRCPVF